MIDWKYPPADGKPDDGASTQCPPGGGCLSDCCLAGGEVGTDSPASGGMAAACSSRSEGGDTASERWGGFSWRCCASCRLAMVVAANSRMRPSTADWSGVEASSVSRNQANISFHSFHMLLNKSNFVWEQRAGSRSCDRRSQRPSEYSVLSLEPTPNSGTFRENTTFKT